MKFISAGKRAINVAHITEIYLDDWRIKCDIAHGAHVETRTLRTFYDGTATENHAAAKEYFDDLIKQLEG